jgi:hypothetical protein
MRPIFRDPDCQALFEYQGYVELDLLGEPEIAELTSLHDRESAELTSAPYSFTAMSPQTGLRRRISDGIRSVLQPRLDPVLDRCRAVLGNFFHKQPSNDDSVISMHQDWSYVDELAHHSLTIWCPFQDVNEANGTLAIVPGSHHLSRRPRGFVTRFPYRDLQPLLRSRYSRHLALKAGQAVAFHQRLFHWSGPNRTAARRLAANCFVAPEEAAIRFPHMDAEARPNQVELFEADDQLLTSFVLGQRPEGARSLGWIDATAELVNEEILERVLGPHRHADR